MFSSLSKHFFQFSDCNNDLKKLGTSLAFYPEPLLLNRLKTLLSVWLCIKDSKFEEMFCFGLSNCDSFLVSPSLQLECFRRGPSFRRRLQNKNWFRFCRILKLRSISGLVTSYDVIKALKASELSFLCSTVSFCTG